MATRGFVQSGREQIYFECWGDTGDAVLLGHGLGGSHATWYQQVASLSAHYRVVTWDQRGFGNSTRSSDEIGPVTAVHDMERVLNHLSIDRAHIVGQSMGGWSALGFAIDHPERVLSLALADTTAGIFTEEIRHTLSAYAEAVGHMSPLDQLPLGYHPAIGAQLVEEDLAHAFLYTQLGSLTEPPTPAEILPLLMSTDHTSGASLLETRALFVVGEHDPIFSPALISSAAEHVNGSEMAIIERTGHSPYFERPDTWNDTLLGFLRQSAD